jgi:hypothetical protein
VQSCPHTKFGDKVTCDASKQCIQIYCVGGGPQPPTATLQHELDGILSIKIDGTPKSVCDHTFDDNAAATACNELYGKPDFLFYQQGQACVQQEFGLDQINCKNVGRSLAECSHAPLGEAICNPANECVRLFCSG